MASAESQEMELDDDLLDGIINDREDSINKFFFIAFKRMDGRNTVSEVRHWY